VENYGEGRLYGNYSYAFRTLGGRKDGKEIRNKDI